MALYVRRTPTREVPTAVRALGGLLRLVGLLVPSQIFGAPEGSCTHVAHVGPVVLVLHLVALQVFQAVEALLANVTLVRRIADSSHGCGTP